MFGLLLVIVCAIAAINWGLVAAFNINAVELITPEATPLRMVREPAYILIGLAGLAVLIQTLGFAKLY